MILDDVSATPEKRAKVKPAALPSLREVREVLRDLGLRGNLSPKPYLTLSARQTWVTNKGYLFVSGAQVCAPENPSFSFFGEANGQVRVWLTSLGAGKTYLVYLRVGGYSVDPGTPGSYRIGASEGDHSSVQAVAGDQVIHVVLPEVAGGLSLVRLETEGLAGWSFYDATVTAV